MEKENLVLSQITANGLISIKQKLTIFNQQLQELNKKANQNLTLSNTDSQILFKESKSINDTPLLIMNNAIEEYDFIEEKINKHLTSQKGENQRMNSELNILKEDHSGLYNVVYECQKKLDAMEMKIGLNIPLVK